MIVLFCQGKNNCLYFLSTLVLVCVDVMGCNLRRP